MRTNPTATYKSQTKPIRSLLALCAFLAFFSAITSRADVRFDVFLGYGGQPGQVGLVHENSWFPVVFEIYNDGEPFVGTIEIGSGSFNANQTRRKSVELPYNTTKVISIPVFSNGNGYWKATLLDEDGEPRATVEGIRSQTLSSQAPLIGAIARTPRGEPTFPEMRQNRTDFKPSVATLRPTTFPTTVLELEGLDALYVNSEKLLDLEEHSDLILPWVNGGGHLVIAVEQPSELQAATWLSRFLPVRLNGTKTLPVDGRIHDWLRENPTSSIEGNPTIILQRYGIQTPNPQQSGNATVRNLQRTPNFDNGELLVSTGTVTRDSKVLFELDGTPLIVRGKLGRGAISVLTFSPEREPFRSWEHRDWFFTKVFNVSDEWFNATQFNNYGGYNIDGVFGAMIDSRQVRKLPISWLLGLLVIYLIVIGPFDQYFLKKINRQMLTWITFPFYVVLFSCLIYFIGYRLRAGDTEWNELHVVDILPEGAVIDWRGRTYASIYSPVNQRYEIAKTETQATLRGEVQQSYSAQESSDLRIAQLSPGFDAQAFVPVWTSQLMVSDWYQDNGYMAFEAEAKVSGNQIQFDVQNRLSKPIDSLKVVAQGKLFDLGKIEADSSQTITRNLFNEGTDLDDFVNSRRSDIFNRVQQRNQVFGQNDAGRLERNIDNSIITSFLANQGQLTANADGTVLTLPNDAQNTTSLPYQGQKFIASPGIDLTKTAAEGNAAFFAWVEDFAPIDPLNQFSPRLSSKTTLLRLTVPVEPQTN